VRIPAEQIYDAEEVADDGAPGEPEDEYGFQSTSEDEGYSGPAEPDRRPCPMCGEMIPVAAVKCRFCGDVFDETLKRKKKRKSKWAAEDESLTPGDWVFCILCGGIACIVGIVYAIQGKPKGLKMVGVSLLAQLFWGAIRAILEVAMKNQ
jgi:ribosomal protein L40E